MVPTQYYLILSAILFGMGAVAFVVKRNIITIFMSIELMLNAVNLAFVAFSQARGKLDGQIFVLFVIVVAAAEAAVGLRSEEHTSELQSRGHLVCRLLLEKKNQLR